MEYYVSRIGELKEELADRRQHREKYASLIDAFAKKEYGIADFAKISRQSLNLPGGRNYGVLCRQVATSRIEEAAYFIASRYLDLKPVNFTLTGDVFNSRNIDKVHLVKVRLITGHSASGLPIVCVQTLAKPSAVEGLILERIRLGKTALPDYHRNLRQKTFLAGIPETRDIGTLLFNLYLKASTNRPPYVFVRDGDRSVKTATDGANLSCARPPAFWYYPLYLANFVSSNLVLFETYESQRGGVPKIKEDFKAAMDRVMDAAGIYPLVVKIPPLDETMLSINEALYGTDWPKKIVIPQNFSDDTVALFNLIANQVAAIKKSGAQ